MKTYPTKTAFLESLAQGDNAPDDCGKPARWVATDQSIPAAHPPTAFTSKAEAVEMWREKRPAYTVRNANGIAGESTHRTPEAACRAAKRREGDGWTVTDQDGARWEMNGPDAVCIG